MQTNETIRRTPSACRVGDSDCRPSKTPCATGQLCSERSSALNQVNDQNDDRNHERQMDQSAAHVPDKTQKPQNEKNYKYAGCLWLQR
jgi:hypothetical protein